MKLCHVLNANTRYVEHLSQIDNMPADATQTKKIVQPRKSNVEAFY